jgi:sensitive to high expression protein 9
LSSSSIAKSEKKPSDTPDVPPKIEPSPPAEEPSSSNIPESPPKPHNPKIEDTIARVPAEDLPSHREGQRWDIFKRIQEIMDELLPKLAPVIHKVNTYTGTDYSSIEALRREIKEQGTTYVVMA